MTPFRVDQIDHVELFVPDRVRAAEWYRQILGFEVVEPYRLWAEDSKGPLMISSDGGSTKLALFTGAPQAGRETAGFHRVAFRVEGSAFLGFVDRVGALGLKDHNGHVVSHEDVVDHEQAFSIYFCDPFGHRLEITTYDHATVRGELAHRRA